MWIDEFSISRKLTKPYSWSQRGTNGKLFLPPASKSYSCILALDSNEVVLSQTSEKSTNGDIFLDFIREVERLHRSSQ